MLRPTMSAGLFIGALPSKPDCRLLFLFPFMGGGDDLADYVKTCSVHLPLEGVMLGATGNGQKAPFL